MLRYIAPIAVFIVMIAVFVVGLNRDPTVLPSPYLGKAAPSFDLPELQDPQKRVTDAAYAGQFALVNVWATWCVGCRQEHHFLLQLARNDVIPIYGINWRDRREDALEWIEELGNPYAETGFDGDGRAGIDWGVYGAPETFLIGKDGTVLYKHLGPLDQAAWDREFAPRIEAANGGPS